MNAPETLLSQDKIDLLKFLCFSLKGKPGDALEVGVYRGGSLWLIAEAFAGDTAQIFGVDTFDGLPEFYTASDEIHQPGEFIASYEDTKAKFLEWPNVHILQGIYPKCLEDYPGGYENPLFKFVHLDVDFGASLNACLRHIWPLMIEGGVILIDDYGWQNTPNIRPTVDHFLLYNTPSQVEQHGNQLVIWR